MRKRDRTEQGLSSSNTPEKNDAVSSDPELVNAQASGTPRMIGSFEERYGRLVGGQCSSCGPALAYYTIFSLAPLLIIAVTIAGLVLAARLHRAR